MGTDGGEDPTVVPPYAGGVAHPFQSNDSPHTSGDTPCTFALF